MRQVKAMSDLFITYYDFDTEASTDIVLKDMIVEEGTTGQIEHDWHDGTCLVLFEDKPISVVVSNVDVGYSL